VPNNQARKAALIKKAEILGECKMEVFILKPSFGILSEELLFSFVSCL
jgi:hypothetical protein